MVKFNHDVGRSEKYLQIKVKKGAVQNASDRKLLTVKKG